MRKNISLLWAAQLTSGIGDAVYQVALMWLVLDLTGSPSITGLVAMSVYLPALIFGLYAGVLSDRYNRQALMILANISQAVTVMLIPL
ncbi:MAG: MFS transporter, partial [Candidatus Neomarinimicrobiota bacterium]